MKVKVWTRGYASDHVAIIEVAEDADDLAIDREVTARFGAAATVAEIFRPRPQVTEEFPEGYARAMSFRDNS